jgi:hypothetical protein
MTIHLGALLFGLFALPLVALALGHRLMRRPPAQRAVFRGLVIGHTLAALVAMVAAMYEPVRWGRGRPVARSARLLAHADRWTHRRGGGMAAGKETEESPGAGGCFLR